MAFEPIEINHYSKNPHSIIAGVDEAGRGPLAGPVSVGFVVFPNDFFSNDLPSELKLLNDSKLVKPGLRELLFDSVKKYSLFHSVVHISNRKIDEIGINPSIELAIHFALRRFAAFRMTASEIARSAGSGMDASGIAGSGNGVHPDLTLVDGNYKLLSVKEKHPHTEFQSIVKGDSRVFSIAAASILAKVSRDRRMLKYHRLFPEYGFDQHFGYGTALHRQKIKDTGYSDLHRKTYKLKEIQ